MPGRHSGVGGRSRRVRTQSVSQVSWRQANAAEVAEVGGTEITGGGNGYIDPEKAIAKLKLHGAGLWGMQAVVAFVMMVIAVDAGECFCCRHRGVPKGSSITVKMVP